MAMLGAIALSGPAAATIYEFAPYQGSDAWTWDDCGFVVDSTSTFGGNYHVREGKNADDDAFYAHNDFWFREVHVPRNGGRTLVVTGHAVFQETRGTRIEGSVFEFSAVVAGQTVVSDGDGNVLVRDRGTIKQTYRLDTLGDETPGGDAFEMLSYTWAGPHPGETTDFCSLF